MKGPLGVKINFVFHLIDLWFYRSVLKSRVESGRCQKSKAADVKAADVAQSGRCCLKQPMIDLKRPMCPKAADFFAKSGRCPLRTKAADVEIFYFEIF